MTHKESTRYRTISFKVTQEHEKELEKMCTVLGFNKSAFCFVGFQFMMETVRFMSDSSGGDLKYVADLLRRPTLGRTLGIMPTISYRDLFNRMPDHVKEDMFVALAKQNGVGR